MFSVSRVFWFLGQALMPSEELDSLFQSVAKSERGKSLLVSVLQLAAFLALMSFRFLPAACLSSDHRVELGAV